MLLLLLLLCQSVFASEVTFVIVPKIMPEGGVYISGSHPKTGSWQADGLPLEKQADGSWKKTVELADGESVEYKITRGSWEKEALDEDGTIRRNSTLTVKGNTLIRIDVPKWKDEVVIAKRKVEGQVTGKIVFHKALSGPGILPRDVQVFIPSSYETEKKKKYPVLYMHDGQQIFDPATSTHGIDWQIDETVTRLTGEKKMKEIIVVGINNTDNRYQEYSDGNTGKAYQDFIIKILKPFIDKTYRTLPERENTGVMGSSMGGIASFLLAWHHPNIFSMAGCFSPAFWLDWDKLKKNSWQELPVRIYIDNGGIGLEKILQPGCDLMLEVLQEKGFKLGKDLLWYQDINAGHSEEEWAKRAWMPLLYMFGKGKQKWLKELPSPPEPLYGQKDKEKKEVTKLESFYVAGISRVLTGRDATKEIDGLWEEVKNTMPDSGFLIEKDSPVAVGLGYPREEDREFRYFCGALVTDTHIPLPEGWTVLEIPETSYIRYEIKSGTAKEALDYLSDWYLPKNNLKRKKDSPSIEWFTGLPDKNTPNAQEVYLPIE